MNLDATISRRTLLRGVGVSMALPWLETLAARADQPHAANEPPVRLAVLFSGNGFHSREWRATGAGATMQLGRVLEPLNPHREKLTFVRGLRNPAGGPGIHSSQTGNLLTGVTLGAGGEVRSGVSFDQVVAQRLGHQTKIPSLVLGCEQSISSLHKGYSMIYSSHISWSSPTTAVPLELYPALAFDRLFREDTNRTDRSVLDAILDDARSLQTQVSSRDRQRVDEYLSSVREVEQRIARAGQEGRLQGWRPTLQRPTTPRPADGIPQDVDQHMRLMCDILILAFQTDTTRVCTLKLNNDHSSLRFPHMGVDYMIHHLLSHSDSNDWLRVNQFFVQQVAYIASRLDAIQEGERTLLDNSIILYTSSMLTGNHEASQLPVVVLGRGGGRLRGGRVLDYVRSDNRKMCSMYLAMMDVMGVRLDRFGDSTQRLADF